MLTIFRTSKDRQPEEPNRKPDIPPQPVMPRQSTPDQAPSKPLTPPPRQQVPAPPAQGRPPMSNGPSSTTIGKDLIFEGNVKGKGSIRVEGEFKGTLEVQNEVIIGDGGSVIGDIHADVVTVEGHIQGNVEARQKININVTGTMIGDIIAPRVVVASGAVYKGRIDMEAALKKQQKAAKETAPPKKEPPKKDAGSGMPEKKTGDASPDDAPQNAPKPIAGPPPKNG